jgi:hypothetical protein
MGDISKVLLPPTNAGTAGTYKTMLTVPANTTYVINKINLTAQNRINSSIQGFEVFHDDSSGNRVPIFIYGATLNGVENPNYLYEADVFAVLGPGDTVKFKVAGNTQQNYDCTFLTLYGVEQT